MGHLSMLAMLAFLGGTAAAAQQTAPSRQSATPPERVTVTGKLSEDQRTVCKRSTDAGSIMIRSVCKTQEQWDWERERHMVNWQRARDAQRTSQTVRDTKRSQAERN